MDYKFEIFILLIIFGYIIYTRKTVEGNKNLKNELELVTFSNNSQKIINDITSKQKKLNILLKMKKTEEIKDKREEIFNDIDTILGDWINDNDKKYKEPEIEKQRVLMVMIFKRLKIENNELNIIYKNRELTSEKIEESEEQETGDQETEDQETGDQETEDQEEVVEQEDAILEDEDIFVDEEEEDVITQDGSEITKYEDISIVEYEESLLDIENVFIFGGIFFLLLCIFGVIMVLTTEEGQRFYRNYIKKYIDMVFTKKEYNYYNV